MLEKWLRLVERLKELWWDAYIVWWAVRDMIMWNEIHDIDIATNVPISTLEKEFHNIPVWKAFWVLLIEFEEQFFEVSQFRADLSSLDWRRPSWIEIVSHIEEDLLRRDFTINAMAYDWVSIIDPYGWQEDIHNRIIRFVGTPIDRVNEDYLRILRWLRFASKLWFIIDTPSMDAIITNSHKIRFVSQERIAEEIKKIARLWGEKLGQFIRLCGTYWILEEILRPISKMKYFAHCFEHHPEGWVYEHILECLRHTQAKDYLSILSILFHDIGKPFTYSFTLDYSRSEPERHRYIWHDVEGSKFFRIYWADELRLSKDEIDTICFCIENHMNRWNIENMSKKSIYKIVWDKNWKHLREVVIADELSTIPEAWTELWMYFMNNNIPIKTTARLNRLLALSESVREEIGSIEENKAKMKAIFNWHDIIEWTWAAKEKVWLVKDAVESYIIDNNYNVTTDDVKAYAIEKSKQI